MMHVPLQSLATAQTPATSSISFALILLIVVIIGAGLIIGASLLFLIGHRHRQRKVAEQQPQELPDPWQESAKRFEEDDDKSKN